MSESAADSMTVVEFALTVEDFEFSPDSVPVVTGFVARSRDLTY